MFFSPSLYLYVSQKEGWREKEREVDTKASFIKHYSSTYRIVFLFCAATCTDFYSQIIRKLRQAINCSA